MADIYYSAVDGDDADNGSTWALAKATLAGAFAIAGDGDTIYADSAGTELAGATVTYTHPVSGGRVSVISVDRNGSTTTGHNGWLKGATITINVNSAGFIFATTGAQTQEHHGMIYAANSGNSAGNAISVGTTTENTNRNITFDNCTLSTPGTHTTGAALNLGQGAGSGDGDVLITLRNTVVITKNTTNAAPCIVLRTAKIKISGLTIQFGGANKSGTLFGSTVGLVTDAEIADSDLSGFNTSGGAYFDVASFRGRSVVVRNCKLDSTPAIVTAGTWNNNSFSITLINADSGDTKTKFGFYNRLGTLLSTESIYRDDGFSVGGTNAGWQIVTTSACSEAEPFTTPWMSGGFNTSTSALTAAIKLIHDSATNLDDREAWMEVSYVSDASFPLGTLASTRNAQPFDGTGADLAADTDAWTGTGGFSNANKQKASKTFTPAEGSAIEGRLLVGVASKTLYLDPQLVIS